MINLRLDKDFLPAYLYLEDYKNRVISSKNYEPITFVVERNEGLSESFSFLIFKDQKYFSESLFVAERYLKSLLWIYGGYKVTIIGNEKIYESLKEIYDTKRLFDKNFMSRVYREPFKFVHSLEVPKIKRVEKPIGKNLDGHRIGFDAGGSDMKVSVVIDGNVTYSEEIVWLPKLNSDPNYHKTHIRNAIKKALTKMDHIDALGVSSAGIFINNEARVASLFIKVPEDEFNKHITNIYIDVAKELGVPLEVANDGDVTALAGSMSLGYKNLLGIAMGTSEAVGYINKEGHITGWLNELAFVPVDFQKDAHFDEWSTDIGCGSQYFSQDAVIRLAEVAGVKFDKELTLAEKLKHVQSLDPNSEIYQEIYKTIGIYLGYGLAYYRLFYDCKHVLLLGRVMSGEGGNIIVRETKNLLKELNLDIMLHLPNEEFRRVGQSIAAASLPKK